MLSLQEETVYCQKILTQLTVAPTTIVSLNLRPNITRNTASFITQFLCSRLSQHSTLDPVERTTYRWEQGIINSRNATNDAFWTNLTESLLASSEQISEAQPLAFLLACWSPASTEVHVWAIPGTLIKSAFPELPLSRNTAFRTLRILPSRNRFEGLPNSPDISAFHRVLAWTPSELQQLHEAQRLDVENRQKPDEENTTETGNQQTPEAEFIREFSKLAARYCAEKIVFRSSKRNAPYFISSVDETGCVSQRVGNDSVRLNWSNLKKKYLAIRRAGSYQHRSVLDTTVAIHSTILQSASIAPAPEGDGVSFIGNQDALRDYVEQRLRRICEPNKFRTAILLAALQTPQFTQSGKAQIAPAPLFEALDQLLAQYNVQATPSELLQALQQLIQEGILLCAQHNTDDDVCAAGMDRNDFIRRVSHLVPHATFRKLAAAPEGLEYLQNVLGRCAPMFSEQPTITPATFNDSIKQLIADISHAGFIYQPWQVASYVTAIRTKPFVILAGVSGTGKTKLPGLVARFSGKPQPARIAVRPDWTDSSEVLGYVDLQGRFRPGIVLQQLRRASADSHHFHVCIVDEMNLARVEHYFAEYLSAVEECVPLAGGGFASTPVLPQIQEDDNEWSSQQLPPNFAVVGTVNMDESTQTFSRKVLDRAFTIELSDIDLSLKLTASKEQARVPAAAWPAAWWIAQYRRISDVPGDRTDFDEILERVISTLTLVNSVLIHAQMQIGYRTRDEIALFVLNASEIRDSFITTAGDPVDPLDLALMMKVLPRLVGSSNLMRQILAGLIHLAQNGESASLDTDPAPTLLQWEAAGRPGQIQETAFPFTLARLCLMYQRLETEGYTSFWL